jgi:AcrR family transcriptional regulator
MASDGFSSFSIDQIARQADVARMTIYHQFGSKSGLLEALCDVLAASGGMERAATIFRLPEPLEALDEYVRLFGRFWDTDRLVTRRLRALAALDPDFDQVIRARDERRRYGVRVLAQRLIERQLLSAEISLEPLVSILFTLSSFETFDALAGPTRSLQEIAPQIIQLMHTIIFHHSP